MTEERQHCPSERRENLPLRGIFDEARLRIVQFLDAGAGWGGAPLELSAFRRLREAYPELSALEVHQLVRALLRVHAASMVRPSAIASEQSAVHES